MSTTTEPTSILTRSQKKVYGTRIYTDHGATYKLTATVRYDDQCGNGHNSFAITGEQYRKADNGRWVEDSFGCLHEDIAKHFPELAPFIKWHHMNSDGPMHYIADTVYHVLEHGPTHAWVYYTGLRDPLGLHEGKEELIGYVEADKAKQAEGQPGYRVKWDEKTVKDRNLGYARSRAIWPDATDDDLTAPGLKERLEARLPGLLKEFRAALGSLGLIY